MIIDALKQGYNEISSKRELEESSKVGIFRAGNAGFAYDDNPVESCPRIAALRFLGRNRGIGFEEHLNVTTGVLHEHHVTDLLLASDAVSKVEVWEEVHQKSSKLEVHAEGLKIDLDGILVSGRPDRVVTINGKRIGLELKTVISTNTAFKISDNFPSLQYMAQILTYQYALQIPFYFLFGQYFIADKFIAKKLVKKQPQFLTFEVIPQNERSTLIRRLDGSNAEKVIDFGIEHVANFYKMCDNTVKEQALPKVPIWDSYNKCDYCHNKDACSSYNSGLISKQEWVNLCE